MTNPARYRCHRCGAAFTGWAPAERHSDAERHHRIEVIIRPGRREPHDHPARPKGAA